MGDRDLWLWPLAEQLADALALGPADVVLDAWSQGGALARELRRRGVLSVLPPAPRAPFSAVASLMPTPGAAPGIDGLTRHPTCTRAAVLTWGGIPGATALAALASSYEQVAGRAPEWWNDLTSFALPSDWALDTVRDVVRFDSVNELWATLVAAPGVTAAMEALSAGEAQTLCNMWADRLATYAAADGTLRIPVSAHLWRRHSH